jgi:hypothetical protein
MNQLKIGNVNFADAFRGRLPRVGSCWRCSQQRCSSQAVISVTLCRGAVLMLWHAFLFLGLRFSSFFFIYLLDGPRCFFLVRIFCDLLTSSYGTIWRAPPETISKDEMPSSCYFRQRRFFPSAVALLVTLVFQKGEAKHVVSGVRVKMLCEGWKLQQSCSPRTRFIVLFQLLTIVSCIQNFVNL